MNVISGTAKGTKLKSIHSNKTRPTIARAKEGLFNTIQFDLKDKVVLDLFAGSGSLVIECLSRGSKIGYFNDINKEAIEIIKYNLEKTRLLHKSNIINKSWDIVINDFKNSNICFDIIFLDPPYNLDIFDKCLGLLFKNNLINNESIIVIESFVGNEIKIPFNNYLKKEYKYGKIKIIVLRDIYE